MWRRQWTCDYWRNYRRRAYGMLPEVLRTWPGACRSGHPEASVAAAGAQAQWLCTDHSLQYGYGSGSPLAKLVEGRGKVLLLGAPFETITLLHDSEHMARLPKKRVIRYREPLLVNGAKVWRRLEGQERTRALVAWRMEGRVLGRSVRGEARIQAWGVQEGGQVQGWRGGSLARRMEVRVLVRSVPGEARGEARRVQGRGEV